jgi:four helix bundle protein
MSRKPFSFEKLDVWNDARSIVREVYDPTRRFPKSETFGLASQLNRASVSVACNLAEGTSRATFKDQAHFSNQAYSSLMETACEIILSTELGFITAESSDQLLTHIQDLSIRIHNLRQFQLRRCQE